jgi:hypothetical protein
VTVAVAVRVRVGEDVDVGVLVIDAVSDRVGDREGVGVMVGVTGMVAEGVCETVTVDSGVSVAKTPIGTTVAVRPRSAKGVKIESFQAGGVRISWLMGSTTARRCFT